MLWLSQFQEKHGPFSGEWGKGKGQSLGTSSQSLPQCQGPLAVSGQEKGGLGYPGWQPPGGCAPALTGGFQRHPGTLCPHPTAPSAPPWPSPTAFPHCHVSASPPGLCSPAPLCSSGFSRAACGCRGWRGAAWPRPEERPWPRPAARSAGAANAALSAAAGSWHREGALSRDKRCDGLLWSLPEPSRDGSRSGRGLSGERVLVRVLVWRPARPRRRSPGGFRCCLCFVFLARAVGTGQDTAHRSLEPAAAAGGTAGSPGGAAGSSDGEEEVTVGYSWWRERSFLCQQVC